jgi:hypothetical protein
VTKTGKKLLPLPCENAQIPQLEQEIESLNLSKSKSHHNIIDKTGHNLVKKD